MLRLLVLLVLALPAAAGQIEAPLIKSGSFVPALPVARGPVLGELNMRLDALSEAKTPAQMQAIFSRQILPAPVGQAATPEAFAARAAVVQALAQPDTIPALKASLELTGGKKAERAIESLEKMQKTLSKPGAAAVTGSAATLLAAFDGASAQLHESVDLSEMPVVADGPSGKKARKKLKKEEKKIRELQERLVAENERSYLEMIQAIDTAGKDGVVKHGHRVNSAWDDVTAFKKPSKDEAAEAKTYPDGYQKRIDRALPVKRHTGVHIRTIYEDLIMPLLLGTMPREEVLKRFPGVLDWELKLMAGQGANEAPTTLRKVFLNLTYKMQRKRLQARVDDPEKHWKFDPNDVETRKRWPEIQAIFGTILARTSTIYAPWEIIGANDKDARNLAYARGTRKRLERMDPRYPVNPALKGLKIE